MNRESDLGKFFAYIALGTIGIGVLLFLGLHSLNFFQFTFQGNQEIYAYLGLLLTSGGAIGWGLVFTFLADTTIKQGISLSLVLVGLAGEMATAVFDMRYNATYAQVGTLSQSELDTMTIVVGLLGLVTGIGLFAFFAGDRIVEAFRRGKQTRQTDGQNNSSKGQNDTQKPQDAQKSQEGTQYTLADLTAKTSKTAGQIRAEFVDYPAFAAWASGQFDHISGGNMKRIWYGEINPTKAVSANPNGRR